MKKLVFLFCLVFIICCENKNTDSIKEFETTLGKKNIEVLNLLVNKFELFLSKEYPSLEIEDAYYQFLLDIKNNKEFESDYFLSEEDRQVYIKSGFKNEIYDSENNVNQTGRYMLALSLVKDSDSLIKKYFKNRQAVGTIHNILFANSILSNDPNFNNYFHKRIVVLEYSF